ncbi:cytochrome P450 [Luteibacter rhizovicinus]|uniref:Cytochrome P450 n=1 Tax=Luteibacter rhizovicinus TaxID=242606 RepID=A0A4R3Z1Z9_9GAMM|nr:cytochrome P450 [Luteibacter rhizovicinus]TCV97833.1 cytochrome P450 [Luteibacter rhizovicinus]
MDSNTLAPESDVENIDELKYSRTIADLPGPKGQPFFGNLLQVGGHQLHLTLAKWIREFGPIYRLNILGRPLVIVSDRTAVGSLLKERPDGFRRTRNLKTIMGELNIKGVITAEGDDWRKQRKLVMGGLNAEVVRNFFPTMTFMTERMLTRWKAAVADGKPVDLRRDLKALALDIVVGIAMGHDIDAVNDDDNQLQRNIDNLFRRLGSRNAALIPYWRYLKLPVDRAADKSAVEVEQAVIEFVRNTRELMKQQPHLQQKPANMLQAMIAASDNPESNFTDQDLIENATLSVIGGEDTTANSIAWMINLLARNPAAAATLTNETDAVLGAEPLVRDWELMKQFPYLEAAHNETQRLRSVAPFIGLGSNADCVVADTFIPKDTAIIVSTIGEGLDEAQFPQNEQFLPERWIFEQKPQRDDDPSRKIFPFGGGARLCPGRFLALTEIKVVVSMIMHNFELELDTDAPPVEQLMNFFMGPSAVPVRLKLRV